MIIEEALYSYLSSYAGLTALVGTRIYPLVLPDNVTLPAVTFQRVTGRHIHSQSGLSGLASSLFQFSCWAEDIEGGESGYSQAKAIAEQIHLALGGYRGTMGGGVRVDGCLIENDTDLYDPETGIYHIAVDVRIWHEEATP